MQKLEKSTISKILILTMLVNIFFSGIVSKKAYAISGTVTFSGTDATNAGQILHDGSYGSSDISGIDLDIFNTNDPVNEAVTGSFAYWVSYNGMLSIDGTTGNGLTGPTPPQYTVIKSDDGTKFSLTSIYMHDWGYMGDAKIECFDGSTLIGSTTFDASGGATFNTSTAPDPTIFQCVTEIRIFNATDVTYGNWIAINDIQVGDPIGAPTYTATLSETGTYTFTGKTVGYSSISPTSITVNNAGTGNLTGLAVSLGGANPSDFTVTQPSVAVNSGGTSTFTVKPNDGLAVGTYTATVTLTGDNGISESFNVSFTVSAALTYTATLSETGTYTFTGKTVGYSSISPTSITVNNTGTGNLTGLAVSLGGANPSDFTVTQPSVAMNSGGTSTFTVKPNDGLAVGTYTATVTLTGDNGISESFNVSFTVSAALTYTATLSETGTYAFTGKTVGYSSISPTSITVNNAGTGNLTGLAVSLGGANPSDFTVTQPSVAVNSGGTSTFTVKPNDGLAVGTYTATVTLTVDNGISESFNVSFTVSAALTYTATLSETGTYTFTGKTVGYSSISPTSITVNNTGTGNLTGLAVSLGGANSSDFTVTQPSATVNSGGTSTFTVKPNDGLAVGTYTATVTLTGDNGISESFNVSFTVSAALTYTATLSETGTYTFTAKTVGYSSISPTSITVNNTGTGNLTGLAVSLGGANPSDFTVTQPSATVNSGGTSTFTVKPNDGLAVGTYTATVTLTGDNGISESFDVSFTVSAAPTYAATLSETGTYTFTGKTVGYSSISPTSITVNNTGTGNLTGLAVSLGGANPSDFTVTQPSATVNSGGTSTFTVKPNDGLAVGTYTATVTLTVDNGISESFNVSLTVSAALTYTATLSETGTYTFTGKTVGYSLISPTSITVNNIGTGSLTNLAVSLSGTNASNFELGTLGATTVSSGNTTSFAIKPKDNLSVGTYTATITLTGDNGISESFNVSFTVVSGSLTIYTLTYTAGANGTIQGDSSQVVNEGDNGTTVTAAANEGYHFVEWSDGKTNESRRETNVRNDISVSARFEGNSSEILPTRAKIKGIEEVGNTLNAELIDGNGSVFTTSAAVTYEWYRSSNVDSDDGTLVGQDKNYELVSSDYNKYIILKVFFEDKVFESNTSRITRKSSSSSSGSSSSSSSSSSNSSTEQIKVDVTDGSSNNLISQTAIQRITASDGTKKDTIDYAANKAQQTVDALAKEGKDVARIVVPDAKDEVSETKVNIPTATISVLSKGNVNLEIDTENARISLPKDSIKDLSQNGQLNGDLYFRLVPIKDEKKQEEIKARASQEEVIKSVSGNNGIQVIGRPMTIETNMSQRPVDITLPLKGVTIPSNPAEREAFLKDLGIFIEHSDGEKVLARGEVVEYAPGVLGIKFRVNKFSDFTIVKLNQEATGWKQVNGSWYFIKKDGTKAIGWHKAESGEWAYQGKDTKDTWFHLESDGKMNTGWFKDTDGSSWYFLCDGKGYGALGAMETGWKYINGTWYFLKENGVMATGWQQTNGKWYYLYSDGSMASNTVIDGYRLDETGAWI